MLRPGHRLGPGRAVSVLFRSRGARRRPGTPEPRRCASEPNRSSNRAAYPSSGARRRRTRPTSRRHALLSASRHYSPAYRRSRPGVNKLPLGVNPIRPKMRGLFACWRNACIDVIKADPEEKLCILARLYLGISSLPPFLGRNRRLAQLVTDQAARELLGKSIVIVGESDLQR